MSPFARRPILAAQLFVAIVIGLILLQASAALALDRTQRTAALRATVQVVVPDNDGNPVSSGSGTVLDPERGYILTNFHVVGDTKTGRTFNDDGMALIGVNPHNLRGAPVFRWTAQMVKGDPQLDLALLKIVAPFGTPHASLPDNLGLSAIPRGSSADLSIGDPVYVLGFPGLGGDTITYTEGTVAGFLDENRDGIEEWIKTDAEVNHGNSGGLAVNDSGQFIGVPSAGRTDAEAAGKISLIRPSDTAIAFFQSATMGEPSVDSGSPVVWNVQYGRSVAADGLVSESAIRFYAGVTDLYASFRFRNIPRRQKLTYNWLKDGVTYSSGVVARGGAETGTHALNLGDKNGLSDGFYELELALDGQRLYRGGVVVGDNSSDEEVVIGAPTFAEGVDNRGAPIRPSASFADVRQIFSIFSAQGLRNGVLLTTIWYLDDKEVLRDESPWSSGDVSIGWQSIQHSEGLPVGRYRVEMVAEGRPVVSGEFDITASDTLAADRTVNVTGRVVDADNRDRTISGATVYFLNPGISAKEWLRGGMPAADVHASGVSGVGGAYQLNQRIPDGQSYGLVVLHGDYRTLLEESYTVAVDAVDPYLLDLPMQQQ